MIKISINKIFWHVVRFECLVGIEILKYEFWPFLQQTGKKTCNGHNFCIRRRNNANNMSKKSWEKSEFESTRVYPVRTSQIPQIPKEKKSYFKQTIFRSKIKKKEKKKKIKKIQKLQKKTQKCITKKIVEFFGFFWSVLTFLNFLDFLNFFGVFWIFLDLSKLLNLLLKL